DAGLLSGQLVQAGDHLVGHILLRELEFFDIVLRIDRLERADVVRRLVHRHARTDLCAHGPHIGDDGQEHGDRADGGDDEGDGTTPLLGVHANCPSTVGYPGEGESCRRAGRVVDAAVAAPGGAYGGGAGGVRWGPACGGGGGGACGVVCG